MQILTDILQNLVDGVITMDKAKEEISDLYKNGWKSELENASTETERYLSVLENTFLVSREQILSKSRKQNIVFLKYLLIHHLRTYSPKYYITERLAEVVGYRNHTSIVWALKEYNKLLSYPKFKTMVDQVAEFETPNVNPDGIPYAQAMYGGMYPDVDTEFVERLKMKFPAQLQPGYKISFHNLENPDTPYFKRDIAPVNNGISDVVQSVINHKKPIINKQNIEESW